MPRRSLLLHGLRLTLTRPGAVFWTYAANLGVALLFSFRLHAQLSSLLSHSLASQRLTAAFDLGVAQTAVQRLSHNVPANGASAYLGLPLYFCVYFLLVPGILYCQFAAAPARLGILLSAGTRFFWRFVRLTLLTLIAGTIILAPVLLLANRLTAGIDDRVVGWPGLRLEAAVWLVVGLIAALFRVYFDLVEAYVVQLDDQLRVSGFPDRRIRRTLLPALRTLTQNLLRAWGTFLLFLALGIIGFSLPTLAALHRLARPNVLPLFLFAQLGMLLLLLSRVAQRGAATTLALDNPLPRPGPRAVTPSGPESPLAFEEELPGSAPTDAPAPDSVVGSTGATLLQMRTRVG